MASAPLPKNEPDRLVALSQYEILDTLPEPGFDDLTGLAAQICRTPIAIVSLIAETRQWFKSKVGLSVCETSRDLAFCAHAILQTEPLIIEDATQDARTRDNVLVTHEPFIRFYVGIPLVTPDHFAIGTLCVIDTKPRRITDSQLQSLQSLARQVTSQLELRKYALLNERLRRSTDEQRLLLIDQAERLQLALREIETAGREAQAANLAKGQFLAKVSHEIRTPLSGVIGMIDLLLESTLNAEQRKFAELGRSCGNSLLALVNDILDWSKIEAGKLELHSVDFDLREVVREVIEMLASRAAKKELRLVSNIDAKLPCRLRGDAQRLKQILLNLIGNGLKFTPEGSVTLNVLPEGASPECVLIRFTVTDTGPGILPEDAGRLFRCFSQLGEASSQQAGTGLGLAISKELAESMGGNIGVVSTPGFGATFWFTANFQLQTRVQPGPGRAGQTLIGKPKMLSSVAGFEPRRLRILVADDQEVNRIIAQKGLTRNGYDCVLVTDGQQAVEAVRRERFDLVLMDCRMPVMDGIEATRAIRSMETAGVRLPIVALTADVSEIKRIRCQEAGMDAFLIKPLDFRTLVQMIESFVSATTTASPPVTDVTKTEPDSQPMELTEMLNRCMNDIDFVQMLLGKFQQNAVKDLDVLVKTVRNRDIQSSLQRAHSFKGAAANVGANRLKVLANDLEDAVRREDFHLAEQCLANAQQELDRCLSYLPKALEELACGPA